MSERDAPQAMPRAAARSRKLTVAVIVLALLPLVLPFPFSRLAALWIGPVAAEQLQQCTDAICQAATVWNHLEWLLALGPSILVAVASIFFGTIGLFRARRHPTSLENRNLLQGSVVAGVVWASLFGCILGVLFYFASFSD